MKIYIYSKQYIIKKKKNLNHCVVCASMSIVCSASVNAVSLSVLWFKGKIQYDKALKASVEHVLNCMDICMCTFQILVKLLSLFNRLKLSYVRLYSEQI